MATKMTKGTTRGNAAVSGTNQYLKKGGTTKMMKGGKASSKMMYGGMKKGGTKKGM
jgi:hypothetical protein